MFQDLALIRLRGHLPKVDTMSRMSSSKASRRVRRQFSEEFKEALCASSWTKVRRSARVARELDLTASALSLWVRHARAERSHGKTGLTKAEREELAALRKENRVSTYTNHTRRRCHRQLQIESGRRVRPFDSLAARLGGVPLVRSGHSTRSLSSPFWSNGSP
jgi:transposase